jgi:SAM-dependent methyltransferase
MYLALSSHARQVRGIDISDRRLEAAELVSAGIPNVTLEQGDLLRIPFQESDCILLVDVLHYFPLRAQNRLLRKCHEFIKPGGRLLLRDADRDRTCRYLLTMLYETIMTRSAFTKGETLCFRGFLELRNCLEEIGFVVDALPMWHLTPFADTLLVCNKV